MFFNQHWWMQCDSWDVKHCAISKFTVIKIKLVYSTQLRMEENLWYMFFGIWWTSIPAKCWGRAEGYYMFWRQLGPVGMGHVWPNCYAVTPGTCQYADEDDTSQGERETRPAGQLPRIGFSRLGTNRSRISTSTLPSHLLSIARIPSYKWGKPTYSDLSH
jgi:hypothetical protein